MDLRLNISFDQVLNMVRKDERDFILRLLQNQKDHLVRKQDFTEAAAVNDVIKLIKAGARGAVQIPNNKEGIPDLTSDHPQSKDV